MFQLNDLLDVVKEKGISEEVDFFIEHANNLRFSVVGHLLSLLGMTVKELLHLKGSVSQVVINPKDRVQHKASQLLRGAGYPLLTLRQLERAGRRGIAVAMEELYSLVDEIAKFRRITTRDYLSLLRPFELALAFYFGNWTVEEVLDQTGRMMDDLRSDVAFILCFRPSGLNNVTKEQCTGGLEHAVLSIR